MLVHITVVPEARNTLEARRSTLAALVATGPLLNPNVGRFEALGVITATVLDPEALPRLRALNYVTSVTEDLSRQITR